MIFHPVENIIICLFLEVSWLTSSHVQRAQVEYCFIKKKKKTRNIFLDLGGFILQD